MAEADRYAEKLRKSTLTNIVGLLGKLAYPLLIVVLTWLFGTEVMGSYFLGLTLIELGSSVCATGWQDAATLFASHHAESDDSKTKMSEVVGRSLAYALVTSSLLAGAVHASGGWVISRYFPEYTAILPGLGLLAWTLVPHTIAQVVSGAAKAHHDMRWDALFSGLRPLLSLLLGAFVYMADGELTALLGTQLAVASILALLSLRALSTLFDPVVVWASLMRPGWDGAAVRFAIPQSLNHTAILYVTRLDMIMLAGFGLPPARLAWYSTAAYLTSNLQQIRIVFSTALAPIVARHHARGEQDELSTILSKTSRWTATMAVPLVLLLAVLRDDILSLIDPSYAGPESVFVLALLIAPMMSCAIGLCGNFVAYTGHSTWNLTNSVGIGVLNTGLNLWLIPSHGLLGAAIATGLSVGAITLLQMVELRYLEGIVIRAKAVSWPLLGLAVLALPFLWLGDPAAMSPLSARLGLGVGLPLAFVALMWVLGHPEIRRAKPATDPR